MTLILDTREIPAPARAGVVRETVAKTMVDVEIFFPEAVPPSAYCAITGAGDLTVCSARSNASAIERTAAQARDDLPPTLFLGLPVAGASVIAQGGREMVHRPGNLAFSESTSPYVLSYGGEGVDAHFFCVPVDALGLPVDLVRNLSAVPLSPGNPLAEVTVTYLRRLGERHPHLAPLASQRVGTPTIELIRALLTTHLGATGLAGNPLDATLPLRILEYLRTHLSDPRLNAAQVAAAHHISVRQLYNILAKEEISLGDWIRSHRLEQVRIELSRPETPQATVGSIAHRWGFRDASSFGRLFRTTYGVSPREWRESAWSDES